MTQMPFYTDQPKREAGQHDRSAAGQDPANRPLHQHAVSRHANHLTVSSTLPTGLASAIYPQFILLGDSITQFGADEIQGTLQKLYIRRLDVINRGFSGYTSPMGLATIRQFLPETYPSPTPPENNPNCPIPAIRLMTIFYGANDACLPGYTQHVPLAEYTSSLTALIKYPVLTRHGTKLILITPPPVDEHQLSDPLNRTSWHTARYASAARNLAASLDIPCVDVWTAFMRGTGYEGTLPPKADYEFTQDDARTLPGSSMLPRNQALAELLVDGLHFTSKGYQVLYDELVRVIETKIPECLPDNLPFVLKPWRECFEGDIVV